MIILTSCPLRGGEQQKRLFRQERGVAHLISQAAPEQLENVPVRQLERPQDPSGGRGPREDGQPRVQAPPQVDSDFPPRLQRPSLSLPGVIRWKRGL